MVTGKGQASLLIVLTAIGILAFGLVYTSFSQISLQKKSLVETTLTRMIKHSDIVKGFSKTALILATHQATSEAAEMRTFFCYGVPTAPSTEKIRKELSSKALSFLNNYIQNMDFSEQALTVRVTDYTDVEFLINEVDLEFGKYDEEFPINAYGSLVNIKSGGNNLTIENDVSEVISGNRFWFLYRKLRDWVNTHDYKLQAWLCPCLEKTLKSCPSKVDSCQACPELKNCLDSTIQQIAESIENYVNDAYIRCYGLPSCCYAEQSAHQIKACGTCNILSGTSSHACTGKYPQTGYLNLRILFTCVDRKYQLSVHPLTDRYLNFSFDVLITVYKQ